MDSGTNASSCDPIRNKPFNVSFSGAEQLYTVPDGVDLLYVRMWGAGGGGGTKRGVANTTLALAGFSGGSGGYSEAYVSVTAGEVLSVVVGGGGQCAGLGKPRSPG